ncbi:BZ3500_MvSof-1268-A1-R1_Chr1-2g01307 [Microbotryum saponariae]|uniref:BZ3500_MvSof-1268-A1-R1_Chr1-2g01307 protein n=1 Tax=Microbotryum saponariae TaxID=289078 RepID=A0A2X0MGW5_9BASI|nr:BZ3500_MvSof-1268-A1-R1_Chr1-2g01307 [Microbotryum saponariae]SCZ97043.1 BZ3501_MvSof-1269-A2-R1_Chr1-2g00906 [Microbotryum saponariae]
MTPKFSATFIPSFFIRSASTRSLCTRANASSRDLSRNVSVCVGTRRCEARIAVEMGKGCERKRVRVSLNQQTNI